MRRSKNGLARAVIVLAAALAVVACDMPPQTPPSGLIDQTLPASSLLIGPFYAASPDAQLRPVPYTALTGWLRGEQHRAWPALRRSCERLFPVTADGAPSTSSASASTAIIGLTRDDWKPLCALVAQPTPKTAAVARRMLESVLTPFVLEAAPQPTPGLFTGYVEADVRGDFKPSARYKYPIYVRPPDLPEFTETSAAVAPYADRRRIEAGLLRGQELLWLDDAVDSYLLQVQGSGRVHLPNGQIVRVGFAGHNGHPYRSIGRYLIERGALSEDAATWDDIRRWLERHPKKQRSVCAVNPRFVFFRLADGDASIGALGAPLTPGYSLAVDPRYVPLGTPLWLETFAPGAKATQPLRRLVSAQDTGGAIRGVVRGDLFWGHGAEALRQAGRMKHPGRYTLLLPKPAAADGAPTG